VINSPRISRSKASRQAMQDRMDAGEMPGFMKARQVTTEAQRKGR